VQKKRSAEKFFVESSRGATQPTGGGESLYLETIALEEDATREEGRK